MLSRSSWTTFQNMGATILILKDLRCHMVTICWEIKIPWWRGVHLISPFDMYFTYTWLGMNICLNAALDWSMSYDVMSVMWSKLWPFLKYSSIVLFGICLMYEIIPKLCPCKNHISYYLKYYIYINYWNIWIEIYNSNIINKDQPFNCTYVWSCLITTTTTTKISYLRWSSPYATMHVHKRGINCT